MHSIAVIGSFVNLSKISERKRRETFCTYRYAENAHDVAFSDLVAEQKPNSNVKVIKKRKSDQCKINDRQYKRIVKTFVTCLRRLWWLYCLMIDF